MCYSGIDTESNKEIMIISVPSYCFEKNPEEQLEEWKALSDPFILSCYDYIVDEDDAWVRWIEGINWI